MARFDPRHHGRMLSYSNSGVDRKTAFTAAFGSLENFCHVEMKKLETLLHLRIIMPCLKIKLWQCRPIGAYRDHPTGSYKLFARYP